MTDSADIVERLQSALADNDLYIKTWSKSYDNMRAGSLRLDRGHAARAAPGEVIGHYIPDFVYYELDELGRNVRKVTEDVKGGAATQTALFKWKAKHFAAQYGYEITIIGGKR